MSNKATQSAKELKEMLADKTLGAYEKVKLLFDDATFVELGAYLKRRATALDCQGDRNSEFEGVVTGYGAIDGRLVFAFIQDESRMKGAISAAHAEKICRLYDMAMKNGAPVVGIFASAGAKVLEGVEVLSGYGKIMNCVAKASGLIPQIAVIAGVCGGACASIASMFDFVIGASDCGQMYVNPPFAVKMADKNTDYGSIASAVAAGLVQIATDDTAGAITQTRKLLNFLPANNTEGTVYALMNDDANRETAQLQTLLESGNYSAKELIQVLCDAGQSIEIGSEFGKEIVTALIQLNGMVVGVCATDPSCNEGALTTDAATKCAKFISTCDCYRIPVLTLVDSKGIAPCACQELNVALAKLAAAYASSTNAKVTVITGKAYGSVFTYMGSKTLGADVVYSVDCAEISILAPEAAIEFLYANETKNANVSIEDLKKLWNRDHASPLSAARNGDIDDIIDYAQLRQRICAAFEMLSAKAQGEMRKAHSNLLFS